MTVTAEAMRKLAALKLDAEQMAGVIDILAGMMDADEQRRAKQRDRVAKHRAEKAGNDTVTLQKRDCTVTVTADENPAPRARVVNTSTFSDEKVLKEDKKDLPSVDPKKRERKIASRMPADWQPDEADREFAIKLGLTSAEIAIETEKIRDWSISNPKGAKLDFGAFWRQWCRTCIERKGSGNGQYRPASGQFVAGGGSRPTGVAGVAAGLALFKASLDGGARPAEDSGVLDLEPYPTAGGRTAYR